MKKILTLTVLAALAWPLAAQHYDYVVTKGKTTGSASWDISQDNDCYNLKIVTENDTTYQKINFDGRTIEWRKVCTADDTDFTVKDEDGVYVIRGKIGGKTLKKTRESKYPWYQSIGFSIPLIMQVKDGNNVTYETVNPKDGKFYSMTATFGSKSKIGKHEVCELHCAAAGMFPNMWNSFHYIDANTHELVSYNAVEGGLGTPRTVWLLVD